MTREVTLERQVEGPIPRKVVELDIMLSKQTTMGSRIEGTAHSALVVRDFKISSPLRLS